MPAVIAAAIAAIAAQLAAALVPPPQFEHVIAEWIPVTVVVVLKTVVVVEIAVAVADILAPPSWRSARTFGGPADAPELNCRTAVYRLRICARLGVESVTDQALRGICPS